MKLVSGLRDIAPRYRVVFCDIWGVVHNGREYFAGACDALARIRAAGGIVILITNAPRPNPAVRAQLDSLGVPRATYDAIVTSGDVTIARIADHGAAPLHHIGPARDLALFASLRDRRNLDPPRVSLREATYVVCTGLFDDRADRLDDYDAALAEMRGRSLDFICANPDLVVHVGDELIYCSGALAQRYEAIGGRVIQAGKPYAPIYEEALKLAETQARRPVARADVLAIGDGLGTDVKGARDFGVDCVFVTTGIHRADLHAGDDLDRDALARIAGEAAVEPTVLMTDLVW